MKPKNLEHRLTALERETTPTNNGLVVMLADESPQQALARLHMAPATARAIVFIPEKKEARYAVN